MKNARSLLLPPLLAASLGACSDVAYPEFAPPKGAPAKAATSDLPFASYTQPATAAAFDARVIVTCEAGTLVLRTRKGSDGLSPRSLGVCEGPTFALGTDKVYLLTTEGVSSLSTTGLAIGVSAYESRSPYYSEAAIVHADRGFYFTTSDAQRVHLFHASDAFDDVREVTSWSGTHARPIVTSGSDVFVGADEGLVRIDVSEPNPSDVVIAPGRFSDVAAFTGGLVIRDADELRVIDRFGGRLAVLPSPSSVIAVVHDKLVTIDRQGELEVRSTSSFTRFSLPTPTTVPLLARGESASSSAVSGDDVLIAATLGGATSVFHVVQTGALL